MTLIFILLAAAGFISIGSPAGAHRRQRQTTHGRFETLPGGAELGYNVRGSARMVRSDHGGGTTEATVRLHGLDADTTYPTHVHNQPCSATPAGGSHYQNRIGGPVDPVNEIWPTISTDERGHGFGSAIHEAWARDDAVSIVVHFPSPNTSIRLACVDLS